MGLDDSVRRLGDSLIRTSQTSVKRVVHLGYSDLLPGAPLASYRLHSALRKRGTDSTMLVLKRMSVDPTVQGPRGWLKPWAASVPQADIMVDRLRNRFPPSLITQTRPESSIGLFGSGLIRQVSDMAPDVVQLHWLAGGVIRLESLVKVARYPLVWRLADLWPVSGLDHYPPTDDTSRPRIDLDRWMLNRKRSVYGQLPNLTLVAPSRWLQKVVQDSELLGDRRVELIPTGTDLEAFIPKDKKAARAALGLPLDHRVILFGAFQGRNNPRKGWRELCGALHILRSQQSFPANIHVALFGDADHAEEALPFPATSLGLLSAESDLAQAYSAADFFVAPSLQENLANTVIEALACGTPVVAFHVGGMPEAITHRVNGYLAAEPTSRSLAETMLEALSASSAIRKRQADAARKRAEHDFDALRQADRYIRLYEELAGEDPRAAEVVE